MAHYALLDDNNFVTRVIVGLDEQEGLTYEQIESICGEMHNQRCKRTSYNTRGGVHLKGGIPFRKNYAGIGSFYDENLDAFIPPKPHPSWILNEETCLWDPPVPRPETGGPYFWDEKNLCWIVI